MSDSGAAPLLRMLAMDAAGRCTPHRGGHPKGTPTARYAFDELTLCMWATPVATEEALDAGGWLQVALPLPFGRELVLGPVVWSASTCRGDEALTVKNLDGLLGRLQVTKRESEQSVVIVQPTVSTAVVEDERHSEDGDLSDIMSDDADELEEEEEPGEEDEGEGEED